MIAERVGRRLSGAVLVVATLLAVGPAAGASPTAARSSGAAPTATASVAPEAQEGSVSGAEAAALARQAVTDDDALRELRAVDEIDGHPVDLAAATASLGGARSERLSALADELDALDPGDPVDDGAAPDGTNADARRAAREVLDDAKYRERDVPRPFRGPLQWMADRLRPVGRFFQDLVDPILALPGGAFILGSLVVGLGAALTAALISRRSRAVVERSAAGHLVDPRTDPHDLDRQADEAEATGDLDGAVRLRYLAGLLHLARADRLVLRADTTAAGAARQVALPAMDRLTADFEEIVYGRRRATDADVAASRAGWRDVLGARLAGHWR